uniref:Glutathione transferase n=1 Tax=Ciona savignyi TaxID=51511 RepID=H2ZLB4_CIOSA
MVIQLYHNRISPPSRAVLMVLNELGLEFEIKDVDLFAGEQHNPEYKKIHPRSKVPALVDGSITVCESRAIASYLCNKYGKSRNDLLYPSDADERAKVDMMLYAEEWMQDTLFGYLNLGGVFRRGEAPAYGKDTQVKECLTYLENMLKKYKYVAADNLTIADFFTYCDVLFLDFLDYDLKEFPAIKAWMGKMKSLSYTGKINDDGMKMGKAAYTAKLNELQKTGK